MIRNSLIPQAQKCPAEKKHEPRRGCRFSAGIESNFKLPIYRAVIAVQLVAMTIISASLRTGLLLAAALATGCAVTGKGKRGSFARVQPVLERNCVHCHGEGRLPQMAAFHTTEALAGLRGKWILPGFPESSRFYQVVAAGDDQPMAMPPTGHAISKKEVAIIREWIAAGAPLPPAPGVTLQPEGRGVRSR